ncbi:tetratricopeptide repeat protein [Bifidobacterium samirii]|uniref:Helicase n=1 Tax=Bifidobacterium samirii TaxID=2306974 RepID=A0A430FVS9_9BIFI|nr:helicase [Bifidobacterium samirii]RSX57821.1 helicase [Bifidobacterium samirii]
MAEEQRRSGGKSYGNRKSYGSSRPGGHGNGGKGGFHKGGKSGGFRKHDGFRKDGERRDGGFRRERDGEQRGERRDFHRDGERREFRRDGEGFRKDGERGGYRGNGGKGGFHKGGKSGGFRKNDGFRKDGERRDGGFRRDGQGEGERREFRRDDRRNDRRDFKRDDRRDFRRDGEQRGERRDFKRDDRRGGDNPRYQRDDRRDFKRDDRRDERKGRPQGEERREFTTEEKREYREEKRREYMQRGPRRNSDGTMSFPSQNPYTDRRPNEPRMPKGMEWSMLSSDERDRLRGLAKEHAENIGLHILAAYALEEKDPQLALEHAKWVARQASRIDFARETLGFIAYRQGDYKLALRELRTAYRMNGFLDYLPFIADCERGTGNPKKAIEVATSDDAKYLRGEAKAEMFLVYAGALSDMNQMDKAIEIVHTLGRSKGLPGEYRMRAIQAEQYFLEECGRTDDAAALEPLLDRLETQYADDDEDMDDLIIDHDLEGFTDDELDMLGISEADAQYAPADFGMEPGEGDEAESDEAESEDAEDGEGDGESVEEIAGMGEAADADETAAGDDETELDAQAAEAGVESDVEPGTGIDDAADAE